MKFYTITQASERLNIDIKKLKGWFDNTYNPLEIISGMKIERIKRRIMIAEDILIMYEKFVETYMSHEEISDFLGWSKQTTINWVSRCYKQGKIKVIKVAGKNYVYKEDILPLKEVSYDTTGCMNTTEMIKVLKLDRSTIIDAITKDLISGGFKVKGFYYAPIESVMLYKDQYLTPDNPDAYYSVEEAAKVLEYSSNSIRTMIYSSKVDLHGCKYKMRKTKSMYYVLKSEVHNFKKFVDSIPEHYYTVKQIADEFNLSIPYVNTLLTKPLSHQVKWIILVQQIERVILKADFNAFYLTLDTYRIDNPEDPHLIFKDGASKVNVPTHLLETHDLYIEFVSLKQNTSRASKQVQRMFAREYIFLYQLLMSLEKELFLYTDSEIKWLLRITTNTNLRKNLIQYLTFLNQKRATEYHEKYRVTAKPKRNRDQEIYSLKEFRSIEKHLNNIDLHLMTAIKDRSYAVTWLYASLHLTNAWRSSDFLRLPTVNIAFLHIADFQWFYDGNRLSLEQAQQVINQYAHTRLNVSKTGALNRFLVNTNLIVSIATMIVVCELHRQSVNDESLLMTGQNNFSLIKKKISTIMPYPLIFSSMKMNRSFMTHLFNKAVADTQTQGIALDMAQQARRHKDKDSTALYIQSTNKDGLADSVSVHLCDRGHFGYLYHLLIEKTYTLAQVDHADTLNERTLKIQEFRSLFSTPLELEGFGEYLQIQAEQKESLALRVAQMSGEEANRILQNVYRDNMPCHTEHAQCISYPHCEHPMAVTGIGCSNMIPKNYLLISIGIELKKRITTLKTTTNSAIALREKTWIVKLLNVLQEATDEFGMEYTKTCIDYNSLLKDASLAYSHQEALLK